MTNEYRTLRNLFYNICFNWAMSERIFSAFDIVTVAKANHNECRPYEYSVNRDIVHDIMRGFDEYTRTSKTLEDGGTTWLYHPRWYNGTLDIYRENSSQFPVCVVKFLSNRPVTTAVNVSSRPTISAIPLTRIPVADELDGISAEQIDALQEALSNSQTATNTDNDIYAEVASRIVARGVYMNPAILPNHVIRTNPVAEMAIPSEVLNHSLTVATDNQRMWTNATLTNTTGLRQQPAETFNLDEDSITRYEVQSDRSNRLLVPRAAIQALGLRPGDSVYTVTYPDHRIGIHVNRPVATSRIRLISSRNNLRFPVSRTGRYSVVVNRGTQVITVNPI